MSVYIHIVIMEVESTLVDGIGGIRSVRPFFCIIEFFSGGPHPLSGGPLKEFIFYVLPNYGH